MWENDPIINSSYMLILDSYLELNSNPGLCLTQTFQADLTHVIAQVIQL